MRAVPSLSVSLLALSLLATPVTAAPKTVKPAAGKDIVKNGDALPGCKDLPSYETLKSALTAARKESNGGLSNEMWGAIVDRSGTVCAVAYTGDTIDAQWPGSRVIAAQKANTANAFSTPKSALSTANLYTGAQPNGFLFGIQESNPVNVKVAYAGLAAQFGRKNDPMVGHVIGGVNVFGGGLALYNAAGKLLGGMGVSGDTSCADHNIAWRARHGMMLDFVPNGVSPDKNDQIVYDIHLNNSTSGFGHPQCLNEEDEIAEKNLPKTGIVNPTAAAPVPAEPAAPAAPAPDTAKDTVKLATPPADAKK